MTDQRRPEHPEMGDPPRAEELGGEHGELDAMLAASTPVEPPPGFTATIMRGVEAAAERLPRWRRWQRARRARRFTNFSTARGVVEGRSPQPGGESAPALSWQGGQAVTKKIMWGLAGIAAVAIVVMWFTGYPPIDRGAEGTIGAAKRAQTQQLSDKDVVLANAEAQAFMQSDAFDRLLKDPNAVKLLNQAAAREAFSNAAFAALLREAGTREVLGQREVAAAVQDARVTAALRESAVREAASHAAARQFFAQWSAALAPAAEATTAAAQAAQAARAVDYSRAALQADALAVFQRADMRAFLESAAFQQVLAQASEAAARVASRRAAGREAQARLDQAMLEQAAIRSSLSEANLAVLRSREFAALLEAPGMAAALADSRAHAAFRDAAFLEAMARPEMAAALQHPAAIAVLAREDVAAMVNSQAFVQAVADPNFAALVANNQVMAAVASREFEAAMRSGALAQAMAHNGFAAAVASRTFANRVAAAMAAAEQ